MATTSAAPKEEANEEKQPKFWAPIALWAFVIGGIVWGPLFDAIILAADILPIRDDTRTLLGIDDGSTFDFQKAFPALLAFVAVILVCVLSEEWNAGLGLASDILPFPQDWHEVHG